jgi:tRNA 2-thiouridine synthesizing protein B
MSTLHIVSSSPFATNALQSALKFLSQSDAILLIENGVYAAVDNAQIAPLREIAVRGLKVYALGEDIDARALTSLAKYISRVSYTDFVALVCQHHNSVSWN